MNSSARGSALLVAGSATLGVLAWAWRDYRRWRALGRGGVPSNPVGWLSVRAMKLREIDVFDTAALRENAAPGYLDGPLPARRGQRPTVAPYPIPHRQRDQLADETMRARLVTMFDDTVAGDERLCYELSHFEKHNQAVWAQADAATRAGLPGDGEIAHIHPSDGSMHITLAPADAAHCIESGWGELHPLAGVRRGIPRTYTLVYPPRDADELAVVTRILLAATGHLTAGLDEARACA